MNSQYPPVSTGRKRFKEVVAKITLVVLGRGLAAAANRDPDIRREVSKWPNGFSLMMNIKPNGPRMTVEKVDGRLKYRGAKPNDATLIINFKNVDAAFMQFTAQIGTTRAFAEHRYTVAGDLAYAMGFVRCMDVLMGHLFPGPVNKYLLKRLPPMPLKKQLIRLYIYTIGIPLGR